MSVCVFVCDCVCVCVCVVCVYVCVCIINLFYAARSCSNFFPFERSPPPPPPNHFCSHGPSLMNVYIVFPVTTAVSVKANFNLKFACVIGGMPRVRCWWLKSESTRGQALWASWSTTETYILRSSSDYFGWWEYL